MNPSPHQKKKGLIERVVQGSYCSLLEELSSDGDPNKTIKDDDVKACLSTRTVRSAWGEGV